MENPGSESKCAQMSSFCNRKCSLLWRLSESGFGASKNQNLDRRENEDEINDSIKITAITVSFGLTSL
jgi:hypothetical protein